MTEISTVLRQTQEMGLYQVYLCETIGEPKDHLDVIQALNSATPMDAVDLFINTVGGYLSTSTQIIDAIKNCEGVVTGHLVGEALSAGSMILLACENIRVAEGSTLMIHNYSSGAYGKGHEIYSQVDFMKKAYPKYFRKYYGDFITEEEMESVLAGNDLWMDDEEITKRLENMIEIRQEIADKEDAVEEQEETEE